MDLLQLFCNQALHLLHSGAYQASVFQILVKTTRVQSMGSTFPVKCGYSFQDNGYPKEYCTQCTVRSNYFCRSFRVQWWFWEGSYTSVQKRRCILEVWSRLPAFLSLELKGLVCPYTCAGSHASCSFLLTRTAENLGFLWGKFGFLAGRPYFSYKISGSADHKHLDFPKCKTTEQRPFLVCF